MKKIIVFILLFPVSIALSMSQPAKVLQPSEETSTTQQTDSNAAVLIKSAVEKICDGNFIAAEQILSNATEDNPNIAALTGIISQQKQIQLARQQSQKQVFNEQLAELEKFRVRPETNEPNLLDVFPVIIKTYESADDTQKQQLLADKFIQKTIAKARQSGVAYESKGQWLDSLIYCYSWLAIIYENDKSISEKKEELEEKALIKASLMDNPCETCGDRYQKVKLEMFTRSLDVLEYGYVEPFYYSSMANKAIKRCRYLAEVLQFSDSAGGKVMATTDPSPLEKESLKSVTDSKITVNFLKDKLPEFAAGLESLSKDYGTEPIGIGKDQFTKLLINILSLNAATINLPEQIVVWHFAEASLSALDPHTVIIWPKEKEDFEKSLTNEFTGIGIEISKADGLLRAVSLLPGTPAYYSGIDAGDIIEAVDGETTRDMPISCAVNKITGPADTKVTLTVRHSDEEKTRNIEVTRTKIIVPTIRGWCRDDSGDWLYLVDQKDNIGYVRITNFSATTASDFNKILTILESQGIRALVLDLRFNTGGYLQSAAEIADMFVDKGIIVSTQPRVGLPSWEAAHKKGTHPYYPLVILINSASASASEIVAGALADKTYRRATLVGQQSYGKGSVQTVTDYPGNGAQLKYTMAYYHLPGGQKVKDRFAMEKLGKKDWGIMPDIQIELRSDEIKKMMDIQRDNDVLAAANHNASKSKLVRHAMEETLQTDHQLAVAVLIAKAKLINSEIQP
jgi:carboxyl-terminal processing protease